MSFSVLRAMRRLTLAPFTPQKRGGNSLLGRFGQMGQGLRGATYEGGSSRSENFRVCVSARQDLNVAVQGGRGREQRSV